MSVTACSNSSLFSCVSLRSKFAVALFSLSALSLLRHSTLLAFSILLFCLIKYLAYFLELIYGYPVAFCDALCYGLVALSKPFCYNQTTRFLYWSIHGFAVHVWTFLFITVIIQTVRKLLLLLDLLTVSALTNTQ